VDATPYLKIKYNFCCINTDNFCYESTFCIFLIRSTTAAEIRHE